MENNERLIKELRGGLYRCEDFDSFRKIYKVGFIYPRDNKNPSKYENSYAQYINKVALFDLKNPSDAVLDFYFADWFRFFSFEFEPVAIAIGLDWEGLTPRLTFFNDEIWKEARTLKMRLIPHIECWHSEPISLEHMTGLLVVCSVKPYVFKKFQPSANLISEIEIVMDEYQTKYNEDPIISILKRGREKKST
jgi:hypothetical protein